MIAVFTKHDQFRREVIMQLEDQHSNPAFFNDEVKKIFKDQYLANFRSPRSTPFVCLESEDFFFVYFTSVKKHVLR